MLQHNVQFAKQPQNPSTSSIPLPSSNSVPPISPVTNNSDPSLLFNINGLDASSSAAKQLAALNAAGIARRASQSGGTSGTFIGGTPFAQQSTFRNSAALGHDSSSSNQSLSLHAIASSAQIHPPSDPSLLHRQSLIASQSQMNPNAVKARKPTMLDLISQIMVSRKTPLPPSVSGIPNPAYDPATSPWRNLEPASQIGGFKLAGKDVDLQKLWTVTHPVGVSPNFSSVSFWASILSHFDLPEQVPHPQGNGIIPTAHLLAQHYMSLLAPVDEYYKSIQEHQRKAAMGRPPNPTGTQQGLAQSSPQAAFMGSPLNANGMAPNQQNMQYPLQAMTNTGQHPPSSVSQNFQHNPGDLMSMQPQSQGGHNISSPSPVFSVEQPDFNHAIGITGTTESLITGYNESDIDGDARKRKYNEMEDPDGKRVRRKTDSEPPMTPSHVSESTSQPPGTPLATTNSTINSRSQPLRKKIEYVPLAREIYTYGGRDARGIEAEMSRNMHGRLLRDVDDWGIVDIDSLTMSLRSRISTELSYSLSTLALLSSMRVNGPHTGFPILQCPDLMEETLDLLEEVAFGEAKDTADAESSSTFDLVTNYTLVKCTYEDGEEPFAGLGQKQGTKDVNNGPRQRPGDIVRLIINCIRNFSAVHDNQIYLARHPNLLDQVLRVTSVAPSKNKDVLHAWSPALTLSDLVVVRKDALQILANLAGAIRLATSSKPSPIEKQRTMYVFQLIASYLVDPYEALNPVNWMLQSGISPSSPIRPPSLPDNALDVFTRISQPDTNRQALSQSLPTEWMWILFQALVHRLPVVDNDFHIAIQEPWTSYIEKVVMAIYSLAFLIPPDMKKRVKNDRSLGFAPIMLRMIRKFTIHPRSDIKVYFNSCARRAIEAMKVIDNQTDSFDTSQPNMPVLSFGMGYGEAGDKHVEKGTGLLGAHQDEVMWGILLQREVALDEVMFNELESLARVDFS